MERKESRHDNFTAEFDALADDYRNQHRVSIAVTGEDSEYFSEYKIRDLADILDRLGAAKRNIFDFGCGIGNSVPFFRKYFPDNELCLGDASLRSIEIAHERFPGNKRYVHIEGNRIPLTDESHDVVFTACVFHHIPHEQHLHWLGELLRITRAGGILVIFEHNPLNPLTVHAVNTCPLDVNAKLIRSGIAKARVLRAGWKRAHVDFKIFFPAFLASLRPIERRLSRLPLGAQYALTARKPVCAP